MGKGRTDFGDIIAKEFKTAMKGKKKGDGVLFSVTNAGGDKRVVRVVEAGPDHFRGYLRNQASDGFSETLTTFNPDLVVSYERG